MEQKKRGDRDCAEKFDIKLKSKPKDGVILQLHHTIREPNGENRRIRFSSGAFDDAQEKLACADNAGNLFVLDFTDLKFWKLTGVGPLTAIHFVPNKLDTLIIANSKNYEIGFLDIESKNVSLTLPGHTAPVKHISFSNSKLNNLLTASAVEAILWELRNYTKYFTLNTYSGTQIQQIMFMPGGEYLVACFQNDTVQIWKHESMKSVKQIIPSELKHMRSIAFTTNGRAMAMAGLTPILILFSMDTWKALKSVDLTKLNIAGAQQIAFVPQVFDGGANRILAMLSSDCTLSLLDLESVTVIHKINPESSGIRKFVVSPSGKYFLSILQLGEVNIYNSSQLLDIAHFTEKDVVKEEIEEIPCTSNNKRVIRDLAPSRIEVEQKMRCCMDSARLRRILTQYGEYPEKFRPVIWRSLLNTPKNVAAYSALVDKGIHPSFKDIEKQFSIHSSTTLKNLKRLLSCLAHWCPLFGVMKFLPGFVFPFVKVLQKDPLLLFECVASVLLNYCQLWFEYAPFPPISILAMAENILAEHDHQVLDHFCEAGITSQTYALKILETAFSEVLTSSEWLILWDHILSNEPAFIIMAIVSYNIVQRNAIKRLTTHELLEKFFHVQNPINKKGFLKKSYILLKDTSEHIHPRKFFNAFISLDKGDCYQQFTGYPKATICLKLAKKEKEAHKSEKYTLKQLSTKCQEKEINARLQKNEGSENRSSSTDECDDIHSKSCKMKNRSRNINTEDLCTQDFLDDIMFPTSSKEQTESTKNGEDHSTHAKKLTNGNICKQSSKSRPKKMSPSIRNDNLEKEIEKLIKTDCNSERPAK